MFTTLVHNFCSKLLLTIFVHIFSSKFCSWFLLKTYVHNTCSQLFFKALGHNSLMTTQLLLALYVHKFCSQLLFTTCTQNFCLQLLFIIFAHNFFPNFWWQLQSCYWWKMKYRDQKIREHIQGILRGEYGEIPWKIATNTGGGWMHWILRLCIKYF